MPSGFCTRCFCAVATAECEEHAADQRQKQGRRDAATKWSTSTRSRAALLLRARARLGQGHGCAQSARALLSAGGGDRGSGDLLGLAAAGGGQVVGVTVVGRGPAVGAHGRGG